MKGALAVLAFAACLNCAALADDASDKQLMSAATMGLAYLTIPSGQLTIESGDLARSSGGQTFRRLSNCVYGLEEGTSQDTHLEIVDFSALSGRYRYGGDAMVGSFLVFDGKKQTTRCFVIAGNKACQQDLALHHMPAAEIQRVIDDVHFVLWHGCGANVDVNPY